ncbi:MAG: hypothetical protein ACYS0K_18245 [Planctomycetota bacterium]|jgi:hypothetical protein
MQPKVWRLLIAPLALLLLASPTFAQGVVDQENDPTPTTSVGCGADPILTKTLGQTFVPDADSLVAVALRLRTGTDFKDGTEATVRILDAEGATVVDDVTVAVSGPADANGDILVLFKFAEVAVTPGDTYLIQWVTPSTAVFTWAAASGDPYADGNIKSCSGNDWPIDGMDCNFITYAAAAEVVTTAAELTCKERLEMLRAHVDDLGLRRRHARTLRRPLRYAYRMLDAGRPKAALFLVKVFMAYAKHTMRWISPDEAEALVAEAEELAQCIVDHHEIKFKPRRCRYRT